VGSDRILQREHHAEEYDHDHRQDGHEVTVLAVALLLSVTEHDRQQQSRREKKQDVIHDFSLLRSDITQ